MNNIKDSMLELSDLIRQYPEEWNDVLQEDRKFLLELTSSCRIANLQQDLDDGYSFPELKKLYSFCFDVWIKTDDLSLERISDFAVMLLNSEKVTIDEMVSISYRKFGDAAFEFNEDVLMEKENKK